MADYGFYVNEYMGMSIPENDWDRIHARAKAQMEQWKRKFTVEPIAENGEDMAICAMADALYYYESAANGLVCTSSSIGSVSSSGGVIDTSQRTQAREVFNSARLYVNIYRGVGKW